MPFPTQGQEMGLFQKYNIKFRTIDNIPIRSVNIMFQKYNIKFRTGLAMLSGLTKNSFKNTILSLEHIFIY